MSDASFYASHTKWLKYNNPLLRLLGDVFLRLVLQFLSRFGGFLRYINILWIPVEKVLSITISHLLHMLNLPHSQPYRWVQPGKCPLILTLTIIPSNTSTLLESALPALSLSFHPMSAVRDPPKDRRSVVRTRILTWGHKETLKLLVDLVWLGFFHQLLPRLEGPVEGVNALQLLVVWLLVTHLEKTHEQLIVVDVIIRHGLVQKGPRSYLYCPWV